MSTPDVPSCTLVTGQSIEVDQNAKTTYLSAFYSSQGKADNSQILLNVWPSKLPGVLQKKSFTPKSARHAFEVAASEIPFDSSLGCRSNFCL